MLWTLVAGCVQPEALVVAEDPEAAAPVGSWRPVVPPSAEYEVGSVRVHQPWPGAPEVGLSLEGYPAVAPVISGARTVYAHGGVTEWWEERPEGLEQGFDVADPPSGELVLELALEGAVAEVDDDGLGATLVPDEGGGLRYEGLAAWDERGVELPARMEATASGVRLVVDTTEAVGAVTVDPLLPGSAWTATSNQYYAHFGNSVASAGDVNGDGYDDLVVGAEGYDNGQSSEGAAVLYLGSAAGLSAAPAWTGESNRDGTYFGSSVASAGDVNGDGYDDVVVGALYYDDGQTDEGAAVLHLGSAAGLSAAPAWMAESNQGNALFGGSVASAGDVNGDPSRA